VGHALAQGQAKVGVLLSGGLDSSCLAALYVHQGWSVRALLVDYDQPALAEELAAASVVAGQLGIRLDQIAMRGLTKWPIDAAMPGRNGLLLLAGLAHFGPAFDVIAIGIHGGSRYWDCSPDFVKAMQSIFDGYTLGVVQVGAPFVAWSKREVLAFARSAGVPVESTYSCDRPAGPCGECGSCRDVRDATA
jgi:7-cyano-7-deazaguanine synthase